MAIEKPTMSKQSIAELAEQVSFDVVVEQVIDTVYIDRDGYGVTPVVAAFGIIAGAVEERKLPSSDGRAYAKHDLTFRFNFDGDLYKIDVEVS